MKFFWLSLLLVPATCLAGKSCAKLDPALISCPAPQAPQITELTQGHVVVQLSVRPDGSVSEARALSHSGHPSWVKATLSAVAHWRYAPNKHSYTKVVPFNFKFGGGMSPNSSSKRTR